MGIFDLLFILVFLASAATLLAALFLAVRGRGARARAWLCGWAIGAAAYLGIVAVSSAFWPRRVLHVGERRCFDDWCIAVENAVRRPANGQVAYRFNLRLSSTARRVSQREFGLAVYLSDDRGRRYDPVPNQSDVPFSVPLAPRESVTTARLFEVPADAHTLGLVIAHEGGFQMGWLIIGEEAWFHKPTIVRLS